MKYYEEGKQSIRSPLRFQRRARKALLSFFTFAAFLFVVLCVPVQQGFAGGEKVSGEPEPDSLYALSAVLYDAEAGRVLYSKNAAMQLPMASTTKIMTLLVVLEEAEPSEIVTVSKNAAAQPKVHLGMRAGEQYMLSDLCYSLMLESHNDTAVALAEHVGGSVEGFAQRMNEKARSLGAFHTQFVTPNGLDAEGHSTTAEDLAKIASYAISREDFRKITNTQSHSFSEITGGRSFTVTNKNRFLTMMQGAIGVKTGFTGKAGYCFVGALEREDRTLVSVVLASRWPPHKEAKWEDTKKLMNYGLKAYQKKTLHDLLDTGEEKEKQPDRIFYALPDLSVRKGSAPKVRLEYDSTAIREMSERSLLVKPSEALSGELWLDRDFLLAPVTKGEQVGILTVKLGSYVIKKIPVLTAEAVEPVSFSYYFRLLLHQFFSATSAPARVSATSIFSQKLSAPTI